MDLLGPLISVDWLAANLSRPNVKVLDGTWIMPGTNPDMADGFIPGAQFFDIDLIADLASPMKHMLPPARIFEAAMDDMGIKNGDSVIVYDRLGTRSSPRLWWTFRMFGHANVAVLNGGLPAWIKAGYSISETQGKAVSKTAYTVGPALSGVTSMDELAALLGSGMQIVDARSQGRFYGTEAEPRAGLRSGHIPGSLSWPVSEIWDGIYLKDEGILSSQIKDLGVNINAPIITTCGSGITAAALALALEIVGAADVSVYDGSWTEWGASRAPVTTGESTENGT